MKLKDGRVVTAFFMPIRGESKVTSPMENVLVFYIDVTDVPFDMQQKYIREVSDVLLREVENV